MTKKEETKDKNESKEDKGTITLSTFKDISNINNMQYAALKTYLKANDEDRFTETKLKNTLKKIKAENAFKK